MIKLYKKIKTDLKIYILIMFIFIMLEDIPNINLKNDSLIKQAISMNDPFIKQRLSMNNSFNRQAISMNDSLTKQRISVSYGIDNNYTYPALVTMIIHQLKVENYKQYVDVDINKYVISPIPNG